MKKKNQAHDDTPSTPLPEKVIETKAVVREGSIRKPKHSDGSKGTPLPTKMITPTEPNYEGSVRGTNYEADTRRVSEHKGTRITSKSKSYPIPDSDIDIYAVDSRIWDRIEGSLASNDLHTHDGFAPLDHEHEFEFDGDFAPADHTHPEYEGGSAGPHDHNSSYSPLGHTHDLTHTHNEYADATHAHDFTHDHSEYADAQTLADHLANHPSGGDGGSYDDTALKARVETNENDIDALEAENNSQNQNIQANTDALADKADANHTHPPQDLTHNHDTEYQAKGDYADATYTHPPQDTTHDHAGTYWMKWKGTQAEYDALGGSRNGNTLYVVTG